ncbi:MULTISPECIES: putative nucleotidyltransferase substrate binding domain-containing protein [unclassified Corynebacterium]|uniref:putative nucleotidyltransferase substrate binding domain-containing protein n=2 Tax=Corynebacteriaceae TaxID=1653 RepID=UPI00178C353A|nr:MULTISPECIES: putative nucleotidyltransferase substrate binding domain-containing protein [unclassified Corynebacterium]
MPTSLHPSLRQLLEQAPQCHSLAMARDILEESHILLRNAISHEDKVDAWSLTRWFSDVVQAVLHSPAVSQLCGGATIVVTGAFGRGHGLPTSGVQWLSVLREGQSSDDAALAHFCESAGLTVHATPDSFTPADKKEWIRRIHASVESGDGEAMGLFADAGTWVAAELAAAVASDAELSTPLLSHAAKVRPPAIEVIDGLPKRDRVVDMHAELVVPLAKLARWASMRAGSTVTETDRRIAAAEVAGVLSHHEAAYAREAWTAAITLQLHRWADRAGGHVMRWDLLPQLDRSAFGAASRLLSDVFAAVDTRYNQAHSVEEGK